MRIIIYLYYFYLNILIIKYIKLSNNINFSRNIKIGNNEKNNIIVKKEPLNENII